MEEGGGTDLKMVLDRQAASSAESITSTVFGNN